MQQVLDENEDLQMLVEQLFKENATLKSQLAEEKTAKKCQLLRFFLFSFLYPLPDFTERQP